MTKAELITKLIASMDGQNSPDDIVHIKNLNDDRTDGEEVPMGIYQINDDDCRDEDGYFEIGFFGPVRDNEDEEEDKEQFDFESENSAA